MICSSDSGSSTCPRSVEPTTSANRIVTVLRVSTSAAPPARAVPHERQKRAFVWFSVSHAGQIEVTPEAFSGMRAARGKRAWRAGPRVDTVRQTGYGCPVQHRPGGGTQHGAGEGP